MSKLILLVGPPGSGKTTYAKSLENFERISQDDQGKNHLDYFNLALSKEQNIVVDRMGFDKSQRLRYIKPALEAGYQVDVVVFYFNFETCFKRCLLRIGHPTIQNDASARQALHTFYSKFQYPEKSEGISVITNIKQEPTKETCVIVDIDGTVANLDHRLHYVKKEKPDWRTFLAKCDEDLPIPEIYEIALDTKVPIIFCSGRGNEYREKTETWLKNNMFYYENLFMRQEKDYRSDDIVKEQILDFEILTRYKTIKFVLDDRDRVVKMWRRRGYRCLQVAFGDF